MSNGGPMNKGTAKRSFDDFAVGERFVSPGVTVTEADIIGFAFQYDPQPFHIDKLAAANSPYGGLIASGWHSLALMFRMFWQTGVLDYCCLGSPGVDEVRWTAPVRPGDTLRTTGEVLSMRPSGSDPTRGILQMRLSAANQDGSVVASFVATIFMSRAESVDES